MAKMYKIKCCAEYPEFEDFLYKECHKGHIIHFDDMNIDAYNEIHPDCPLPDYKDKEEY